MPLPNWIESTGKGIGLIPVHCLGKHGNSHEADWNSPRVFLLLQAETTGNMGMPEEWMLQETSSLQELPGWIA